MMSNVKIAKYIAILLGACIVLCTYFVFLKILNKKTGISGVPVSTEIVLKVPENAEVKDVRIAEGKIYFLIHQWRPVFLFVDQINQLIGKIKFF